MFQTTKQYEFGTSGTSSNIYKYKYIIILYYSLLFFLSCRLVRYNFVRPQIGR